jgi:hypothetical protein
MSSIFMSRVGSHFYNCLSFSCAAHFRRVPGHIRWSYTVLLPYLLDVEKLDGEKGELWLLGLVGQSPLYLQLHRYLASRDKSGVAGACSVMLENGRWVPPRVLRACLRQGRKILMLPPSTPFNKLNFQLLFINYLKTLDTLLRAN